MKVKLINYKKNEKPNIELEVHRVEADEWHNLGFSKHHYLTSELNKSCKCLLFTWNGEPVGFVGVLNTPRKGDRYSCAISRVVVLPDYQGLGLSSTICNFVGGIITNLGDDYKLYIKTIHDRMGKYFERSDKWIPTSYNGKIRKNTEYEKGKYNNRLVRKSYCYKYCGEKIDGYNHLLLPINEMRNNKNG